MRTHLVLTGYKPGVLLLNYGRESGARRTCTPVSGCRLISLAPSPGSLVRYMLQKCSRPDLHRHKADLKLAASASWATGAKSGPQGGICTRNLSVLRGAPLLVGLQGVLRTAVNGPHGRICTRTVSVLSGAPPSSWATWGKWCSRQDLHLRPSRSKRAALICCATGA